ncbi:N-glycosylase/DNA lyase [Candidatus Dependentiae bacterium]|nr:N-glycosylase/DNA lyase [Candidatus Dependentiae bacterium]
MEQILKNLLEKFSKETLNTIDYRIEEFKKLNKADNDAWFSELCFCILTANSQAKKAIAIQTQLGSEGFLNKTETELAQIIRSHAHRFHNNKAKYIVTARQFKNIKDILKDKSGPQAREFVAKNIKGLGYKEASHFLRNVGFADVAIIDRHILKFMKNYNLINEIPKVVTPKKYLECEDILKKFKMELDRLDLILWFEITGNVLK